MRNLPDDILKIIARKLDYSSLNNFFLVCKRTKSLTDEVWKELLKNNHFGTDLEEGQTNYRVAYLTKQYSRIKIILSSNEHVRSILGSNVFLSQLKSFRATTENFSQFLDEYSDALRSKGVSDSEIKNIRDNLQTIYTLAKNHMEIFRIFYNSESEDSNSDTVNIQNEIFKFLILKEHISELQEVDLTKLTGIFSHKERGFNIQMIAEMLAEAKDLRSIKITISHAKSYAIIDSLRKLPNLKGIAIVVESDQECMRLIEKPSIFLDSNLVNSKVNLNLQYPDGRTFRLTNENTGLPTDAPEDDEHVRKVRRLK